MLERIIAFILSVIMTIFPFFEEKKVVSNEEVAEAVIYAVENKDASAIEKYMCQNIKDNFDDLTGEINTMLSYIEGDIENITWESYGGYYESDGNGKAVKQNNQSFEIFTTNGVYGIGITLETDNSFNPDELGIRTISLFTKVENTNPHSSKSYPYVYGESLYKIFATEGIGEMHD